MKNITVTELKQKIDSNEALFLLDIRENYEREVSHIPSEHIPMGEVPLKASEFPKEKEIVVICRSGRRAVPVADLLENDFLFPNVSILQGGLLAWKQEIDPTLDID
ncbi:MAG: rhodanese-like domain-containing protein [Bacteroidota bacterium]